MVSKLYLASNSISRQNLLTQAGISFSVIAQDADESLVSYKQPLSEIVMQLAELKMNHAKIPAGTVQGQLIFVVTADTLGLTEQRRILCKPVDKDDAISMLKDAAQGTYTATGFCVQRMRWEHGSWQLEAKIIDYDQSFAIFNVSDLFLSSYLEKIPYLSVSGAVSIEGFGGQFLQSINGSYETIVGLPMFKLRTALCELGFYHTYMNLSR